MKEYICALIGTIGTLIAGAFGGWDHAMITLIIFLATDYITGLIVAGVFHKSQKSDSGALESRAGFKGLCRKGLILLFVLISERLDVLLGLNYIRNAVIIAYCANELLSIIENAGLMGVPIPKAISNAIEILKKKENE